MKLKSDAIPSERFPPVLHVAELVIVLIIIINYNYFTRSLAVIMGKKLCRWPCELLENPNEMAVYFAKIFLLVIY